MEVTVTRVAKDRPDDSARLDVLCGLVHDLGKPRDWYDRVGDDAARARAQRKRGVVRGVSRVPQLASLALAASPTEVGAAEVVATRLGHLRCACHRLVAHSFELKEEGLLARET